MQEDITVEHNKYEMPNSLRKRLLQFHSYIMYVGSIFCPVQTCSAGSLEAIEEGTVAVLPGTRRRRRWKDQRRLERVVLRKSRGQWQSQSRWRMCATAGTEALALEWRALWTAARVMGTEAVGDSAQRRVAMETRAIEAAARKWPARGAETSSRMVSRRLPSLLWELYS